MIRKAIIGTAVAATLGTFVFGRDVFSYAKTWGSSVRDAVKSEVPVEFEVQRAREMVEDLVPDIRNCMHVIAEQQVDIEYLEEETARKENDMADQKGKILALREDLESGNSTFVYASQSYTSDEVKRDLAQRFRRFKLAEETFSHEKQVLEARKKALSANQIKLENMLVAKQDLELDIEQLEARMKAVQAAETVSSLEIDHSQLNRAKKLIRELNKHLDVKEKMLDADGKFTGLIPVEVEEVAVPENIGNEIDAYFSKESSKETKIVDLSQL